MINSFINSTTFGQVIACSFDMNVEGTLADKRLTAQEDCVVNAPIYTKELSAEKIASYIAQGKKVDNLGKAVETENKRVNSLFAFVKELEFVASIDNNEPVIFYIPAELLSELVSGRYKFYIADNAPENSYYSEVELNLWKEAMPLMKDMFDRIVFKDINACKKNLSKTPIQEDRVNIYASMYDLMLKAFREMKASKTQTTQNNSHNKVSAF